MATTRSASKATIKGLEDLFLDGLKDIYYAEKKILKALPKMAKGAEGKEVRAAFEKHLAETEAQVERLEQVFELIGVAARRQDLSGHRWHHRGGFGDPFRVQGCSCARCRPCRGGAGRRALRDRPLWHVDRLGRAARACRRCQAAPSDLDRRGSDGRSAERFGRRRGERTRHRRSGLRRRFDPDAN